MADSRPCNRPAELDTLGRPDGTKCLMHWDQNHREIQAFKEEIDAMLSGRSASARDERALDFTSFVFPLAVFSGVTFPSEIHFDRALFTSEADFTNSIFVGAASFQYVNFSQGASFANASFRGIARFAESYVAGNAGFQAAKFLGEVDFSGMVLGGESSFAKARFEGTSSWNVSIFKGASSFSESIFQGVAEFSLSRFRAQALFRNVIFRNGASFEEAVFDDVADFTDCRFGFLAGLKGSDEPAILDVNGASFAQSERVKFTSLNLGAQTGLLMRLGQCNPAGIQFWAINWYSEGGRLILQDEFDARQTTSDRAKREASCESAVAAYRRMLDVFENSRQTDLAEDCYCGTMRIRQLHPREKRIAKAIIWVYGLASAYGSSYARAFWGLLTLLLAFGLVFALAGLNPRSSMGSPPQVAPLTGTPRDIARGLFHALQVATFQRETTHVAANAWSSAAELLESILVPSQLALFLLALNRRFKR